MNNLTNLFVESFMRGLGKAASTVVVFGITGGIYMFGNWLFQNHKANRSSHLNEMYGYVDLDASNSDEGQDSNFSSNNVAYDGSNESEIVSEQGSEKNIKVDIDSSLMKRRNAISEDNVFKKMMDKLAN